MELFEQRLVVYLLILEVYILIFEKIRSNISFDYEIAELVDEWQWQYIIVFSSYYTLIGCFKHDFSHDYF